VAGPAALEQLKQLMGFRLVIVTTLLLAAVYVEVGSRAPLPINPYYFLIGATYGLTVVHALVLERLPYRAQVYLQVGGDLLTITGLVYVTGGARTGFILLYPLAVLTGSALLVRGWGVTLSVLATLLYAGILLLVRGGLLPPQGLSDVPLLEPKHLLYPVFVTGVACAAVGMIGSYLARSLRAVGERLEEASEQVADLQQLNEVIVNSIQSGLMTCDAQGRILYSNAFGDSILGLPSAKSKGRTLSEVFGSSLEGAALGVRALHDDLSRVQISHERPDGVEVELGVSVSPLATVEPGGEGYLLVFQDLTKIKRLEAEVRLKEKLAAVGEVAAQLAHEIRNPLGSISGSAQVLMADPGFSDEQDRLLRIITRESRRLSDTLNQVLLQARPSPASPGPVDVGSVVSEAMTLLRNAPEVGPAHDISFESDGASHVCLADRDQIAQVFWNLARNGLEAMPGGGELRVSLSRKAKDVSLVFRDQGRGMTSEERRRVFEPFRSGSSVGVGLGLAIVYRIVKEHRGDIQVRSGAAGGTEVEVLLPLLPSPQRPQ